MSPIGYQVFQTRNLACVYLFGVLVLVLSLHPLLYLKFLHLFLSKLTVNAHFNLVIHAIEFDS